MATHTIVTLVCDLCDSEKDVESHEISIDGYTVMVDVCAKDWAKLQKVLTPMQNAGTREKRSTKKTHTNRRSVRAVSNGN